MLRDQHSDLFAKHNENAAEVDKPIAGLLKDLKARSLLKDTLVVWSGEFGRTPVSEGGNGRDHNPYGYSLFNLDALAILAQVKAAQPTRDFDPLYGAASGPWTTEMFVEAAYQSLAGKK